MGVFSRLDEVDRAFVLSLAFIAVATPAAIYMALGRPGVERLYGNRLSEEGLSLSQQEEIAARLKPFIAERNGAPMQKETSAGGGTRYEFNVDASFVRATYDGDTNNCPRFKVVLKPEAGSYSTTQSLTVCPE